MYFSTNQRIGLYFLEKPFLIIISLLCFTIPSLANDPTTLPSNFDRYSKAVGNWNNSSTWTDGPNNTADATIPSSNQNVLVRNTLNAQQTSISILTSQNKSGYYRFNGEVTNGNDITLNGGGASQWVTLDINSNVSYKGTTTNANSGFLKVDTRSFLVIRPGGVLTVKNAEFVNGDNVRIRIESGGKLIVLGKLTNGVNNKNFQIDGELIVDEFENKNNGVIHGTGSITARVISNDGTIFNTTGPIECTPPTGSTTCTIISPAPTPIVLKHFLANPLGSSVKLSWATSSEINNDFFTVERSQDGINFDEISRQAGAGNSIEELSYTAVDMRPLSGRSYYRLKQTDYDGTYEYSPVQSVFINAETTSISIFPNPASSQAVTIMISGQKGENAQISVSTLTGKVVEQLQVQIKEQSEELVINGSTQLKQGVYIVTYKSASASNQQKLVIR